MRAVVQRVAHARVTVAGQLVGACEAGLLALLCAMHGDQPADALKMAGKIARLRVFADAAGKMNLAAVNTAAQCLVVSQFTLSADCSKGNRPSFAGAANPAMARQLCATTVDELRRLGLQVATGSFGAHMQVELVNDGPVTVWLDTTLW